MRTLAPLFVLAVLSGAGCSDSGNPPPWANDCVLHESRTITASGDNDPPMLLRIDSCRVDVDACNALCAFELQRANIGGAITSCTVTFAGDTARSDIAYDMMNPMARDCAVPTPEGGAPVQGGL